VGYEKKCLSDMSDAATREYYNKWSHRSYHSYLCIIYILTRSQRSRWDSSV
jgi:hypothetical protein